MSDEHARPTVDRRARSITVSHSNSKPSEPTDIRGRASIERILQQPSTRFDNQPSTRFDSQPTPARTRAFGGVLGTSVLQRQSPARLLYRTFGETPVGDPAVDALPEAPPGAEAGDAGHRPTRGHIPATNVSTGSHRGSQQHSGFTKSDQSGGSPATIAAASAPREETVTSRQTPPATEWAVDGDDTQSAIGRSTRLLTARHSRPIMASRSHQINIQHRQAGDQQPQPANTTRQQPPATRATASGQSPSRTDQRTVDQRTQRTVDQPDAVGGHRAEKQAATAHGLPDRTDSQQSTAMAGPAPTTEAARRKATSRPARTADSRQSTAGWAVWPTRTVSAASQPKRRRLSQSHTAPAAAAPAAAAQSGLNSQPRHAALQPAGNGRQPTGRPSLVVADEQHRSTNNSVDPQSSTTQRVPRPRATSTAGQPFGGVENSPTLAGRPVATQQATTDSSARRLARLQRRSRTLRLNDTQSTAARASKRTTSAATPPDSTTRRGDTPAREQSTGTAGFYIQQSTVADTSYNRTLPSAPGTLPAHSVTRPDASQPGVSKRSAPQGADRAARRGSAVDHSPRQTNPERSGDRQRPTASTAAPWPYGKTVDRTRRASAGGAVSALGARSAGRRRRESHTTRPSNAVGHIPPVREIQDGQQSSPRSLDQQSVTANVGRSDRSWSTTSSVAGRRWKRLQVAPAEPSGQPVQETAENTAGQSTHPHQRPVWPTASVEPPADAQTGSDNKTRDQQVGHHPHNRFGNTSRQRAAAPWSTVSRGVNAADRATPRQQTVSMNAPRSQHAAVDHRSTPSVRATGVSRSVGGWSTTATPRTAATASKQSTAATGRQSTTGQPTAGQPAARRLSEPQQTTAPSVRQRVEQSTTARGATEGDQTDVDMEWVSSSPTATSEQPRTTAGSIAPWGPRSHSQSTVTHTTPGQRERSDQPTHQPTVAESRPASSVGRPPSVLQVAEFGGSDSMSSATRSPETTGSPASDASASTASQKSTPSIKQFAATQSTAARTQRSQPASERSTSETGATGHRTHQHDDQRAADTAGAGTGATDTSGQIDRKNAQSTVSSIFRQRGHSAVQRTTIGSVNAHYSVQRSQLTRTLGRGIDPSTDPTDDPTPPHTVGTTLAASGQRQSGVARLRRWQSTPAQSTQSTAKPPTQPTTTPPTQPTAKPATQPTGVDSKPSGGKVREVRNSDDVASGSVAEFERPLHPVRQFKPQLSVAALGSTATSPAETQQRSEPQRAVSTDTEGRTHRTSAVDWSTAERARSGKQAAPDDTGEQSTAGQRAAASRRPRLTVKKERSSSQTNGSETGGDSKPGRQSTANNARRTAANHPDDGEPSQSTADPFGTVERADSQPAGRAGSTGDAGGGFGQHPERRRRRDGSRDDTAATQQVGGTAVGSLSYDADVDRLVETLYRRLERKLRIERERKGL